MRTMPPVSSIKMRQSQSLPALRPPVSKTVPRIPKQKKGTLPRVQKKQQTKVKKVGFLSTMTVEKKNDPTPNKKTKKTVDMKDALAQCKFAWDDENRMDVLRSQVLIKYSHYNKTFEARNGIVRWEDIDEEYAISFVFKGKFKRHIWDEREEGFEAVEVNNKNDKNDSADYFMCLKSTTESYLLKIEEDETAGIIGKSNKYVPHQSVTSKKARKGRDLITEELKQLSSEELRAQGEEMKRLIEARDVEDILFNN